MNVKWTLVTLAVVILVSAGITGCKKKEDTTGTVTVQKTEEANAPAEHPESAKPKDHPAH